MKKIKEFLTKQTNFSPNDEKELANKSVELAKMILQESQKEETLSEKLQGKKMKRMMLDLKGKAFTLNMCDQVFRPPTAKRATKQLLSLIQKYGIPRYFFFYEKIGLKIGSLMAKLFPQLVMPMITQKMREETKKVILPSENKKLKSHLHRRKKGGIKMNINQLGEAVLGEKEANARFQQNLDRLKDKDCNYISVKISSIFSQINLLAFDDSLEKIKERLRLLYKAAIENSIERDGEKQSKFVNLDMEEYRDLELTCIAFQEILMEKEFLKLEAGIVLQAYLPDCFEVQKKLTQWSKKRREKGGGGIKIRIVKGANLAMEKVEASLHHWEQAPYLSKEEVDANYKRMVFFGCQLENIQNVRLGIGSHNLFDISYALILRAIHNIEDKIEFEMLEGMANHQARLIKKLSDNVLLYAPVVKREDFHSAIAYLVRRLDENTEEENFLHDLFEMKIDSPEWEKQKNKFLISCAEKNKPSSIPNRQQNRDTETPKLQTKEFKNQADTDWVLKANREWITQEVKTFKNTNIEDLPIQINGKEIKTEHLREAKDPSKNELAYRFSNANESQIEEALETAKTYQGWKQKSIKEKKAILEQVAIHISKERGQIISAMILDGGKSIPEADVEISEAIDFANYYSKSLSSDFFDGTSLKPLGSILVISPWNFPFAIPCGGILAGLMAGNNVIIKPSSQSYLIAWKMAEILWEAGIPKQAMQCLACDSKIGKKLVSDQRVDGIILTGGHETALRFLKWRPETRLFAETSGKNSMIISATADPDQAIKDLTRGAFGHSGQKCSASSLAIIEAELYDNKNFLKQLKDATKSLKVGPAWDFSSIITPVIKEASDDLLQGLTQLEEGETWLLKPEMINNNPCIWSPGIRLGVKPKSWYHKTECFGPVLGLMRAKDLQEAIKIQNDSEFGLTGGIHSLNEEEIETWKESVEVGNAYINRGTTGAIVQRQPFGGWKKSCFGIGSKAGGPNYVVSLGKWEQKELPKKSSPLSKKCEILVQKLVKICPQEEQIIKTAAKNFTYWWEKEFSREHDPSKIYGENNIFRYRPLKKICLRQETSKEKELALCILASFIVGNKIEISTPQVLKQYENIHSSVSFIREDQETFLNRLRKQAKIYCSLRTTSPNKEIHQVTNKISLQLIDWEILANGRIELLHYLREQSISHTIHRYGNIIESIDKMQK